MSPHIRLQTAVIKSRDIQNRQSGGKKPHKLHYPKGLGRHLMEMELISMCESTAAQKQLLSFSLPFKWWSCSCHFCRKYHLQI